MNAQRVLLILALLGCLVAPGGMALQVCFCELLAPLHCATSSRPTKSEASRSKNGHACCDYEHGEKTPARNSDPIPVAIRSGAACSCILLQVHEQPPAETPPSGQELPAILAPARAPAFRATEPYLAHIAPRFWARIYGPPGVRANLPLRI